MAKTNAEYLMEQFSGDVSKFAAYLCAEGWTLADMAECEAWLKMPVDDDLVSFFSPVSLMTLADRVAPKEPPKHRWK